MAEETTTTPTNQTYQTNGTWVPLSFGTTYIETLIVETESVSSTGEKLEITNGKGNIVAVISGYGQKSEYSFSLMPSSTATVPTQGVPLKLGDITFLVDTFNVSKSKEDVVKWDITGTVYPYITFTTS